MAGIAAGLMLAFALLLGAGQAANAETRTLKLYFLHTKERAEIAYKRNGRYLKDGLNQINHILRDWRRNEPTQINPVLLDVLWAVYQESGSNDYFHVVSAYRSPKTNAMLRSKSSGVAKNSQHTKGNAVDFYLPDVNLSKLRAIGLKLQAGGVGYYPRSGSPFVHLDVGSVRHWPRMSHKELVALFPEGKTLHVPSNGKPLPGYEQAKASYEQRRRQGELVQVAGEARSGGGGLLSALFGRRDRQGNEASTQVASAPQQPTRQQQQPAPQQQAQTQAQERQETPARLLAELPATALPVPASAPRPDTGRLTDEDERGDSEAPVAGEEAQDLSEMLLALNAPVPSRRPENMPAENVVEAADEAVDQLEIASTAVAYATPTPRPATSASSDAIAELLATRKGDALPEGDEAPVLTASETPTPTNISPLEDKTEHKSELVVAALSDMTVPSETPEAASIDSPPQVAFLSQDEGSAPKVSLSKGARTTGKAGRPRPGDQRQPMKSHVLPVRAVVADLVLSRRSMLDRTLQTEVPTFNARMADAPKAVYTDGFKRDATIADARRFTGSAVTFLTVAKFED